MGREDAEVQARLTACFCLFGVLAACSPPTPQVTLAVPALVQAQWRREAGDFQEALRLIEHDSSAAARELRALIHYDPDGPSLSGAPPNETPLIGLARAEQLCRMKRCPEAQPLIDAALAQRKPDDLATLVRAGRLLLSTNRQRTGECVEAALPLARKLNEQNPLPVASLHWITATDELYADLLAANRHLGHARGLYFKALTPYRHWPWPSAYTERRRREIEAKIAALDRALLSK